MNSGRRSGRPGDGVERLHDALRGSTAHLLASVTRQVQAAVERELREDSGLRWAEYAVLMVVVAVEGLSQQAITERTGVDRTSVSAAIENLFHEGLVRVTRDPFDGRKLLAAATADGRTHAQAASRAVEKAEREALRRLDRRERDRLRQLLDRSLPPAVWSPFFSRPA